MVAQVGQIWASEFPFFFPNLHYINFKFIYIYIYIYINEKEQDFIETTLSLKKNHKLISILSIFGSKYTLVHQIYENNLILLTFSKCLSSGLDQLLTYQKVFLSSIKTFIFIWLILFKLLMTQKIEQYESE